MKTIKQLLDELSTYSDDCFVYAYEGEGIGIAVRDKGEQVGWIDLEPD